MWGITSGKNWTKISKTFLKTVIDAGWTRSYLGTQAEENCLVWSEVKTT